MHSNVSVSGVVLDKVVEYLYYHQKYADSKDVPDMEIPPELCLELLYAADYLNLGEMLTLFEDSLVLTLSYSLKARQSAIPTPRRCGHFKQRTSAPGHCHTEVQWMKMRALRLR